jgi:hypothetical protein
MPTLVNTIQSYAPFPKSTWLFQLFSSIPGTHYVMLCKKNDAAFTMHTVSLKFPWNFSFSWKLKNVALFSHFREIDFKKIRFKTFNPTSKVAKIDFLNSLTFFFLKKILYSIWRVYV